MDERTKEWRVIWFIGVMPRLVVGEPTVVRVQ
jgi:hypothetical protein